MRRRRKPSETEPSHPPVSSISGSGDPLRMFYEPPPELAQHFTKRSLTQFDCHECGLDVRDWQLETHWRWHERLSAAFSVTQAR